MIEPKTRAARQGLRIGWLLALATTAGAGYSLWGWRGIWLVLAASWLLNAAVQLVIVGFIAAYERQVEREEGNLLERLDDTLRNLRER